MLTLGMRRSSALPRSGEPAPAISLVVRLRVLAGTLSRSMPLPSSGEVPITSVVGSVVTGGGVPPAGGVFCAAAIVGAKHSAAMNEHRAAILTGTALPRSFFHEFPETDWSRAQSSRRNWIVSSATPATGAPACRAGSNRQVCTAATAAWSRTGWPLLATTEIAVGVPVVETEMRSFT